MARRDGVRAQDLRHSRAPVSSAPLGGREQRLFFQRPTLTGPDSSRYGAGGDDDGSRSGVVFRRAHSGVIVGEA